MSTQLPTDAESFARFLTEQIENGGADKSPEDLLRLWRVDHAAAIEDVRSGIKNIEAGRGVPFEEVDTAIRAEFGFYRTARCIL